MLDLKCDCNLEGGAIDKKRFTVQGSRRTAKNKIDKIQMSRSASGEVVIEIREAYDRVFSDASVAKEQVDTAAWFETFGSDAGQEW
jgi:hypothetical protein